MAVIPDSCSHAISPAVRTKAARVPGAFSREGSLDTASAMDGAFHEGRNASYPPFSFSAFTELSKLLLLVLSAMAPVVAFTELPPPKEEWPGVFANISVNISFSRA